MKKKKIIHRLLILLCFVMISFCVPGTVIQTSYAADDPPDSAEVADEAGSEIQDEADGDSSDDAYAVFDSSDGSLVLFRGDAGMYEDGETSGTKTYYSGIEEVPADSGPKWSPHKLEIRSFSVSEGDVIRPASCSYWFDQCSLLDDVDLKGLDTSAVSDMSYMFSYCASLTSIDLTPVDMTNVTNMLSMFKNCNGLTFIKLGESDHLDRNCGIKLPLQRIKLGDDSSIVSDPVFYTADEYTSDHPGWYRPGGKAIAIFDPEDGSLTFENDDDSRYLDSVTEEGTKTIYSGILNTGREVPWGEYRGSIRKVAVKVPIAPVSLYMWFQSCYNLNSCDFQLLDTSHVDNMRYMVAGCSQVYRIALGEKSIFSVNLPNSGWKRYMLPDGTMTGTPELNNLANYTGDAPGWYSRNGANICAVYDSEDHSLAFFNDVYGEYFNGQIIGAKTYYENFVPQNKVPWNNVKENIEMIDFLDRIEPNSIRDWFSGCTKITELDLTNLKIPGNQRNAFKGCTSLKSLIVPINMSGQYIEGDSMLSGIWKNTETGEEHRLVMDGGQTEDIIGRGEWELVTSASVSLEVNADALGDSGFYDNDSLMVLFTEDSENPVGEPIKTFSMRNGQYEFSVPDSTYISPEGNIEYYDYIIKSSREGIDITWVKEQGDSVTDIRIKAYLRDVTMTDISGTINWKGDRPDDRPEKVTAELWQNGVKIAEQDVRASDDWKYSFYVPAYDSDRVLYRYEVREAPVENYKTEYKEQNAIRFITERLKQPVGNLFFRKDGRWYMMHTEYNGGIMTIPGDAFYMPVDQSMINIPGVLKMRLSQKAEDIADTWNSYQAWEEIPIDDWLIGSDRIEGAENGIVLPLTGSDSEILMMMSNFLEIDAYKDFYTVTDPFPIKITDDRGHVLCGTYNMNSITNVSLRSTEELTGRKIWDSDTHPEEVTVILKQNGEELKRVKVAEAEDWEYSFSDVPTFDRMGREYEYTLTEKPIKGYVMTCETGISEDIGKAVKITYEIDNDAFNNRLSEKYFVAYDQKGNAYRYQPEQKFDSGEYTVIFPTMDFDLVFKGAKASHRGIMRNTKGFPISVISCEITDSPYEYSEGAGFSDREDADIKWTEFDPAAEVADYPDRTEMYHYGENEKGILAKIYIDRTSIIPYTMDSGKECMNLRNEYREGKLTVIKTDKDGDPLKDAEFGLFFCENDPEDETWTKCEQEPTAKGSTDENGELIFDKVPVGCYILEELKASPGYRTDPGGHKVIIGDEEKKISIKNEKTLTVIRKENEKGELLGGAELGLYDSSGNEIDSWISSGTKAHEITGLTEGGEYVLKELKAPEGFRMANDVRFEVKKGEDTIVSMKDLPEYVFMPIPTGVKTAGLLIPVFLLAQAAILRKVKYYKR